MPFTDPIPFAEAIAFATKRKLLPSNLSSEDLEKLPVQIRERALFSARTNNAWYLQQISDQIQGIVGPELQDDGSGTGDTVLRGTSMPTARLNLKRALQSIGYNPDKPGTMEDLSSDQRLNLVLRTQTDMARGYGHYVQDQEPDSLYLWPAQELFRAEARIEPRDWPERWSSAGGSFFDGPSDYEDGRMIAMRDDPIWEDISRFGLPYPPYDFGSGMWVRKIARAEAIELGLMEEDDADIVPEDRDFDDDLEASGDQFDPEILDAVVESLGEGYGVVKGIIQLLNEKAGGKGCLMAMVRGSLEDRLLAWSKANIPDAALDLENGRETEMHVTVFCGFNLGFDPVRLQTWLRNHGEVKLTLGNVTRFELTDYDVLKVDVHSEDLERLHGEVDEEFRSDTTRSQWAYHPHLTLAYVKKGECKELDGSTAFEGDKVMAVDLLYSLPEKQGRQTIWLKDEIPRDAYEPLMTNEGTTDGAIKGWETRRAGGIPQNESSDPKDYGLEPAPGQLGHRGYVKSTSPDVRLSAYVGKDKVFLLRMDVDEAQQGKGIGGRTIEKLKAFAAKTRRTLELTAAADSATLQPKLNRFYEAHGLKRLNRDAHPDYSWKANEGEENCGTGAGGFQPGNTCAKGGGTETQEFKAWFGDSKVVNAEGKPLVAYHGTIAKDFTSFSGKYFGATDAGYFGYGHYFTVNPKGADAYALREYGSRNEDTGEWHPFADPKITNARIYPVHLSIKNPYRVQGYKEFEKLNKLAATVTDSEVPATMPKLTGNYGMGNPRQAWKLTRALQKDGYDGVIINDDGGKITEVVAFHPTQIKSVLNRGTWSKSDKNISNESVGTILTDIFRLLAGKTS